jgi:tetratricopeptide (TPR) repeat protein
MPQPALYPAANGVGSLRNHDGARANKPMKGEVNMGINEDVRIVTELELRRAAAGLDGPDLVIQLQLRGATLDVRTLRRWEERSHVPVAVHRDELCGYFEVGSEAELGLGCGPVAARWWAWMTEAERTLEVHRRRFCIVTGGAMGACVVPVPKLTAAAQLLGGSVRIGAGDVSFATEVATDIASSYAATPNAEVITAAKAHAYTLLDLLKHASMSPETEVRLRAVASDAVSLAGFGHLNAGRLDEAEQWFGEALTLARQAGDRRLEAFALASSALPLLIAPVPDYKAVMAALEAAAELQRFLPPAGRALVFGYLARERAAFKDDLGSGRFLEQARTAATLIVHDEPGFGWWSIHGQLGGWEGESRPRVFAGTRSLRLGRAAEALRLFDEALEGTTLPVRRSHLHKWVMDACVGLRDPDRACASGIAALDEGKTHGVGVIPRQIRKVRDSFPPRWSTLAPVIELDERLALAG